MKIFSAVGNKEIEEIIREVKDIELVDNDEPNLETVLNLIEFISIDVLILNRLLSEQDEIFIKIAEQAKKRDIKIVMLLHNYEDYKEKKLINSLVTQDVHSFIKFDEVDAEILSEAIFNYPDTFDFNMLRDSNVEASGEVKIEIKERVIKQHVITFYATDNNIDKNDVLTQITCLLAKKSKQKILVIDMDTLTPSLHQFFNVKKETAIKDTYDSSAINTGLTSVYNAIEKNIFAGDLLEELVSKHKKLNNVHILTGIYDINLVDSFEEKHYQVLIDVAKSIYDTVIINTHSDIALLGTYTALSNATEIIMVSGANYINSRNTNYIMNYLIDYQKFPKGKFKVIINNLSSYSLNKELMTRIFKGYDILGYLPFNPHREEALNRQKTPFILTRAASKDVLSYLNIIEKIGYIPKTTFFGGIFRKRKIVNSICQENDEAAIKDENAAV